MGLTWFFKGLVGPTGNGFPASEDNRQPSWEGLLSPSSHGSQGVTLILVRGESLIGGDRKRQGCILGPSLDSSGDPPPQTPGRTLPPPKTEPPLLLIHSSICPCPKPGPSAFLSPVSPGAPVYLDHSFRRDSRLPSAGPL